MPLGVELAAAWVDMLSLTDIATEIQKSLDFLETNVRNIPERHRSIRAVVDTSWQQMDEAEREIFPQLSIFRGGFTRKAAQEVTGASLRLLGTLASKSLLQYNKARDRYQIHELLRQYGADKLAEQSAEVSKTSSVSTAVSNVHDRHSAYFCSALQRREADLKGAQQQAALAKIEADIENVWAAWNWAVEQEHIERLARALNSLGYFYAWRGRYQEGEAASRVASEKLAAMGAGDEQRIFMAKAWARVLAWQGVFGQILGRPELASQLLMKGLELLDSPKLAKQDTRLERAFILSATGKIALDTGDRREDKRVLEQSLALYRATGDRWGMANTLQMLSTVAWNLSTYNEARQFAEKSLTLHYELGDQRGIASSLDRLGLIVMFQGQLEESKRFLRESITIHQKSGDLNSVASATGNLGSAYKFSGEFVQAIDLSEQAVAIYSDTGVRHCGLAHYQAQVGNTNMHLGRYKKVKTHIQSGLKLARELGDQRDIAMALGCLGDMLLAEEEYAEAQQKFQEGVTIYGTIGQRSELAWTLSGLSLAANSLGQISEAERHVFEALQIVSEIPAAVFVFEHTLGATAYLLASQGRQEQAVELYALASRYPYVANSRWFDDVIGQHTTAAAATLPPEVVEAAQTRGQARDLETTITELLAA
jgi:tetratricopeptide (TPR) repeat protein